MQKTRSLVIVWLFFMPNSEGVCVFEFEDTVAIGAAYMTHLSLHENRTSSDG